MDQNQLDLLNSFMIPASQQLDEARTKHLINNGNRENGSELGHLIGRGELDEELEDIAREKLKKLVLNIDDGETKVEEEPLDLSELTEKQLPPASEFIDVVEVVQDGELRLGNK